MLAVLFWAALSHRVYNRTLPYGLLERAFGEDANDGPYSVRVLLRKLYSVIAFALIGFVVDRALPRARRAGLRAALIVAAFSGVIEVAQKMNHAEEGPRSEAFDVACGFAGGWLGAALSRRLRRRRLRG